MEFVVAEQLVVKGSHVSLIRWGVQPINPYDSKEVWRYSHNDEIILPKPFVVLHDPTGNRFDKCSFFVVHLSGGYSDKTSKSRVSINNDVRRTALKYYGKGSKLKVGSVDIPEGPWHRVAEVGWIRYRRTGKDNRDFQHPYALPVWLYACDHPLAWRIELPAGCVVDTHGFIWP